MQFGRIFLQNIVFVMKACCEKCSYPAIETYQLPVGKLCLLSVYYMFLLYLLFSFADERDDLSKVDSNKFKSFIEEVDTLHQLGKVGDYL